MDYKGIRITREDAIRASFKDKVGKGLTSGAAVRATAAEFSLTKARIYQILSK